MGKVTATTQCFLKSTSQNCQKGRSRTKSAVYLKFWMYRATTEFFWKEGRGPCSCMVRGSFFYFMLLGVNLDLDCIGNFATIFVLKPMSGRKYATLMRRCCWALRRQCEQPGSAREGNVCFLDDLFYFTCFINFGLFVFISILS